MQKNVGTSDRLLRGVVGLALIAWALTVGPVWAWVGVVPLITAVIGICPLYSMLGVRTIPTHQH